MIRWLKRICLLFMFVGLLALNVLTLTSQLAFSALSGLLDAIPGLQTNAARIVSERIAMEGKIRRQNTAVRSMGQRALRRARRLAAFQVVEVGSSYVPLLGAAIVIGGTLWELQQLCAGATEVRALLTGLEIEETEDSGLVDGICGTKLPSFLVTRESVDFPSFMSDSWENSGPTDLETLNNELPN